jgi:ADP-ribose pyrophosphatase YjhB (NUDIX family)
MNINLNYKNKYLKYKKKYLSLKGGATCSYKNVSGFLIDQSDSNKILMVRNKYTKEWMLPGGEVDRTDTGQYPCFNAYKREYKEETGYDLPQITNLQSFIYGMPGHTKIYYGTIDPSVVNKFNPTHKPIETDAMEWKDLNSIINNTAKFPVRRCENNSLKFARKKNLI